MGHSEVALMTGSVKFQTILWDCCRGVTQFPATLLLVEASLKVKFTTTQYTIQTQKPIQFNLRTGYSKIKKKIILEKLLCLYCVLCCREFHFKTRFY